MSYLFMICHTRCVTSCQKSGHLRDCPCVRFLHEKKGEEDLHRTPTTPAPACSHTRVRRVLLRSKEGFYQIKTPYDISKPSSFSLITLLQLWFCSPLPALAHCSCPPVLAVSAPVLWSTRLNPPECIDCPDETVITAQR